MGSFGPLEIILIFLVVLLIFGAKRIPEIARGIGKGIREFKDATSEISQELESEAQNRQINRPQSRRSKQASKTQASENQSSQKEASQQQESSPEPAASGEEPSADTAESPNEKPETSS